MAKLLQNPSIIFMIFFGNISLKCQVIQWLKTVHTFKSTLLKCSLILRRAYEVALERSVFALGRYLKSYLFITKMLFLTGTVTNSD